VLVLFLEPAGQPRFLTTMRRKGVNLTKKSCEFKIFLKESCNIFGNATLSHFFPKKILWLSCTFFFFWFCHKVAKIHTKENSALSLSLSFRVNKSKAQKQKQKALNELKLVVEAVVFFGAKFGCGSSKPSA
jgi:hypothetical protein